ncbi:MAG: HAMP domain-containing sensor histidine kinase [Pseudomonadota bacterium]
MYKKLHNYAVRCPIVAQKTCAGKIAKRFESRRSPRCVIVAEETGAPRALHLANAPAKAQKKFLVVDKSHTQDRHIIALSKAPPELFASGAVVVDGPRISGWISPEALAAWLSKMARGAQRRADESAKAVQRAQEQSLLLLANMSHELRTPLNAIIGYTDLMREGTFGAVQPSEYGQYVDSIHLSGQHLLSSINAVLNLARVDAGVVQLDEQDICIEQMIDQCIDIMQTQASELDVKIVKTVPCDFPMIFGDLQLLRQALLNLMSNAVKFAPPGSRVRVSAARTARSGVRITVGDRGPGIPEKDMTRILEPFKQASHGAGRTGVGTGLGLSLSKAFIELHEGRLHLLSQEGRGTRAIMTVPSGRVLDRRSGFQHGFAFVRGHDAQDMQTA